MRERHLLRVRQRLIPLSQSEEWREALHGIPHAFGHTWESCYAVSLTTNFKTYLYEYISATCRIVCPIAERNHRNCTDLVTPYGFSGFAGVGNDPDFQRHWKDFATSHGYVCGYIVINPIFAPKSCFEDPDYCEQSDIYILDFAHSAEALYGSLSKNRRRQIKKFAKGAGIFITDRVRLDEYFVRNIGEFLWYKRASETYAFSKETYQELLSLKNVLILGAGSIEGIQAACLFAYSPSCAEYMFGISREEGRKLSAPLLWRGAELLRNLGIPKLNLGGGITRADTLAEFKERFGAQKVPFGCLKQVYQPETYKALCYAAGVDPVKTDGFFPPYQRLAEQVPP
jgi:hypothetical protein